MAWRVSLAVVAVALVNVVLGLDWSGAPQPLPRTASVQRQPNALPLLNPPPVMLPAEPRPAEAENTGAAPPAPDASQARAQAIAAPPGCNVKACEAAYKSFRASDCTYQPFEGERRVCRKR